MTTNGYARVSTTDQDLDIQIAALKREGCTTIRSEKRSGTSTANREELRTVLDFLRKGDVLMVTRIDRLARSIGDLQDIVRAVRAKGASLKATERPIDTSTAAGKCFLDMLGVFAEFETNLRRERQLEGIAKAKALQGSPPIDRRGQGTAEGPSGNFRLACNLDVYPLGRTGAVSAS
jgi:DNA invertase Pin-like site-specific DNA recombinase